MRKRTARAILAATRTINKAMDILERESKLLEDRDEESNVRDDINWVISHLSQAAIEGLDHHVDDANEEIYGK